MKLVIRPNEYYWLCIIFLEVPLGFQVALLFHLFKSKWVITMLLPVITYINNKPLEGQGMLAFC